MIHVFWFARLFMCDAIPDATLPVVLSLECLGVHNWIKYSWIQFYLLGPNQDVLYCKVQL